MKQTLEHICKEGLLVDFVLRSFTHYDVPIQIRENIENVRILNVTDDHIVVGPKKPICRAIINIDEIGVVLISDEIHRDDEDEIDMLIEREYPHWQRHLTSSSTTSDNIARNIGTGPFEEIPHQDLFWNLENHEYIILSVYSHWCQMCKEVETILEELYPKYRNVRLLKINGDLYQEFCEEYEITAFPTVLMFRNGEQFGRITGKGDLRFYETHIDRLIGIAPPIQIDMLADGTVHFMTGKRIFEVIHGLPLSVVMFYKRGDYESQLQSRAMNELAKEYKSKVYFAKIDVDKDNDAADLFDVEDTPEVYFLHDGEMIGYSSERLTKSELRDAIEEALSMVH